MKTIYIEKSCGPARDGAWTAELDPAGAERLIKSLDPAGVALTLRCSSRAKAEDMAEKIERWSE